MTKKNEIAKAPKNIAEKVLGRVQSMQEAGGLTIPADYSAENALNAAYLKLKEAKDKNGNPVEKVCTPESTATALLDMVVQGLSPARNQCYFIAYGKELTLQRSYMGTVMAAKRFTDIEDVFAAVVYEDDIFEYEINPKTGVAEVTKHKQAIQNRKGQIVAAYATILRPGKDPYQEIMTWGEIQNAWNQSSTKGNSPAHKNFAQEMSKKTVINRACKLFVNSATDQSILAAAFNRTTENEYKKEEPLTAEVEEVKEDDLAAIFGDSEAEDIAPDQEDHAEEKTPEIENVSPAEELTEEEKAEIIAAEEAAAEEEGNE